MTIDTRQRLRLVDPTTQPVAADFVGAPRLRDLSNKRVGLIDDSKLNARELLEEVVSLLDSRFGVASVDYHRKPSASKPASPETIERLARECDYVVVGVGDRSSCSACSVHDGIHVDKAGTPSVTICTDAFVRTFGAMAAIWGAPSYPVIFTQHPIGPLSREQLRARGDEMIDRIVAVLTGTEPPASPPPDVV
jgi:hypothetical protein